MDLQQLDVAQRRLARAMAELADSRERLAAEFQRAAWAAESFLRDVDDAFGRRDNSVRGEREQVR